MKTYIKGFLAGICTLAFLAACDTEKKPVFDTGLDGLFFGSINSNNGAVEFQVDTTRLAFGMLPDPSVESSVFTVPTYLIGAMAGYDREVNVEVLREPRNSGTRYEIVRPLLLKAGETSANIDIRIWRTDNLMVERDTIVIGLKDSKDLVMKVKDDFLSRCITIYGGFDRPTWWNEQYVNEVIGRFHEIKMEILLEVLGSTNNPFAPSANQWWFNQIVLNAYCEDNNITYPGTSEIVSFLGENFL